MIVDLSRAVPVALALSIVLGVTGAGAAQSAAAASCSPGSGPQLAGRTLTNTEVSGFAPGHLRCADLAGADLAGLSLIQVDLTGANLRHADLHGANLGQATMNDADLSGANLSGATLDQSTDEHANFRGANLTGASAVQVDLTGANMDGTQLGGTDFAQATFSDTKFQGVTGLFPWSLVLLLVAGLFLVLLLTGTLRKARRSSPGRLAVAVLGCVLAAFGLHLLAGGLIEEFVGGFGSPVPQACSGPQCAVGIDSGLVGIFAGVFALLFGMAMRARRTARPPVASGPSTAYLPGGGSAGLS